MSCRDSLRDSWWDFWRDSWRNFLHSPSFSSESQIGLYPWLSARLCLRLVFLRELSFAICYQFMMNSSRWHRRQTCANLIQLFVYRNINITCNGRRLSGTEYCACCKFTLGGLNLFILGKKLATRDATLGWLRDIGLIPSSRYCKKHKRSMTVVACRTKFTRRVSRRIFGLNDVTFLWSLPYNYVCFCNEIFVWASDSRE